jgi:Spy/CpxP family protein refolding chaperone
MKTKILFLAVLVMLAVWGKAQPRSMDIRSFKGMNMMQPDSNFRGLMRSTFEKQRRMNQEGIVRLLDLNDDQVKAIKEMQLLMHKEVKPVQNKLNEALAHQKTLLSEEDPDMKAINENIEKTGDLRTQIQKIRIKYLLEMRSKLTDEQRMKLEMMKEHHFLKGPRMDFNFGGNAGQMNRFGMGPHSMQNFDF